MLQNIMTGSCLPQDKSNSYEWQLATTTIILIYDNCNNNNNNNGYTTTIGSTKRWRLNWGHKNVRYTRWNYDYTHIFDKGCSCCSLICFWAHTISLICIYIFYSYIWRHKFAVLVKGVFCQKKRKWLVKYIISVGMCYCDNLEFKTSIIH